MAIRVILVPVSGGAATAGAADAACRLGLRFGGHLRGVHVRSDARDLVPMLGQDIAAPVAADLVELAIQDSADHAAKAREAFEAALARHGIPMTGRAATADGGVSAEWREAIGDPASVICELARVSDLVVLGQSGRVTDQPYSDTLDQVVMNGGRPVLLAPMASGSPLGEVMAIAWNDSPEAARAVAGALPFLVKAHEVHVLYAGAEEMAAPVDLADYLAWHGVATASARVDPVDGVGTGELLLAAARDRGADILVMGGYGHAPWREMMFGGATRRIVGTSRLPILLAH